MSIYRGFSVQPMVRVSQVGNRWSICFNCQRLEQIQLKNIDNNVVSFVYNLLKWIYLFDSSDLLGKISSVLSSFYLRNPSGFKSHFHYINLACPSDRVLRTINNVNNIDLFPNTWSEVLFNLNKAVFFVLFK